MYCITLYTYYHTVYSYFSMHLIACVGTGSIITEWSKKKNPRWVANSFFTCLMLLISMIIPDLQMCFCLERTLG